MKIAPQVAEMERRQKALLNVIRKELDHTRRLVRLFLSRLIKYPSLKNSLLFFP